MTETAEERIEMLECEMLALDVLLTMLTRKGVLSQDDLSKLRSIIDGDADDLTVQAALNAAGGEHHD